MQIKHLILAFTAFILAGCTSKPELTAVEANLCDTKSNQTLVRESTLKSNGRDVTQCNYEWVYEPSGHIMDVIAPDYRVFSSTTYIYKGKSGTWNDISKVTANELRQEERAKKIAEREAKEQACQNSPECMAEREKKKNAQLEHNKVCDNFFKDLSSKTNFSHNRIVLARPMMTGAYICVAQGVVTTPHGSQFKQIELTGNPDTGVYEYK
ncbi:hypothetical protein QQ213_003563 [Vibrio vulnificus]|nr:hypothetical protein [Vibrio vulnificus]